MIRRAIHDEQRLGRGPGRRCTRRETRRLPDAGDRDRRVVPEPAGLDGGGPGWSWAWLQPRLIAADHVRFMVHGGRVVGVMTQPYGIGDLGRYAGQLAELTKAGFEVDVCPLCSPHYPGYTIAVIHYRPADHLPSLHLPHD
jgi:hypothetical protein